MTDPTDPSRTPERKPEPTPQPRPDGSYEVLWKLEPGEGDGGWDLPERFELQRDLGDGPAGPVFLVRDSQRNRASLRLEVVSSARAPSAAARDVIEADLTAVERVTSPHVARCLEIGRLGDGRVFALYEHTEGETLERRLARETVLHPAHALEIVRQILRALQALHDAGLTAGELSTRRVWLDNGVPKRDDNPFGVGARLLATGAARATPVRGAAGDLRSVGELLVAMLGAARQDGALATAARGLAQRLRAEGDNSLSNARAAQSAVEALLSRTRTLQAATGGRRAAPWRRTVLTVAVLALAGAGVLAWRSRNEAEAAYRTAADQRSRFELAQAEALARIDRLRGELAEGEVALHSQLDQLESALRGEGDLHREARAAQETLRSQLAEERGSVARLTQTLEAERAQFEAVQARLAEALALSEKSIRAARGLDHALELLASREGARAQRRVLALEAEGLFGERTDFASLLANASAHMERFEATRTVGDDGQLDLAAAVSAQENLALASEQLAAFLDEASGWIELRLADSPPGSRVERVQSALAGLRDRARAAAAERELAHEREWFALQGRPAFEDPQAAFQHAERFGCEHLDELGARFVFELREAAVVNGSLDARTLAAADRLAVWAERVRSGEVRLSRELARDVELLDAARRWYGSERALDSDLALDEGALRGELGESTSWRSQLALQWLLARGASVLGLEAGGTSWRVDRDPSGRVEWWREVVESDEGGVYRLRRTRFTADGATALGEGLIDVERAAERVRIVGSRAPLVDLRASGAAVTVARAPLADPLEPPAMLDVASAGVDAVRNLSASELCLVYTHGDVRRWISPRLGLVREETRTPRGVAVTQLVGRQQP